MSPPTRELETREIERKLSTLSVRGPDPALRRRAIDNALEAGTGATIWWTELALAGIVALVLSWLAVPPSVDSVQRLAPRDVLGAASATEITTLGAPVGSLASFARSPSRTTHSIRTFEHAELTRSDIDAY